MVASTVSLTTSTLNEAMSKDARNNKVPNADNISWDLLILKSKSICILHAKKNVFRQVVVNYWTKSRYNIKPVLTNV